MPALLVGLGLALLLSSSGEAAAVIDPGDFEDSARVSGLTRPVAGRFLPDGSVLILQKEGGMWVADPGAGTKTAYLTIPDVDTVAERGAMDLVLAPDFATSRHVYVYRANRVTKRLEVVRFTYSGNAGTDLATLTTIWQNPGANLDAYGDAHMGGSLNFGNDGKLYISVGDGLNPQNAGNLRNVFGSILRINPNGTIPANNPFNDGAGPNADEIWAHGLRNPWRARFDAPTGRFYIGDVGGNDAPTAYEEVNIGTAGSNYGWPDCQGPLGPPKNGPNCPGGVKAPIAFYDHDAGGGCCFNASVTGGLVVRGPALPTDLDGAYVYADFPRGELYYLRYNGSTVTDSGFVVGNLQLAVSIDQGPDGHIYYINYGYQDGRGQLRRLRYDAGGDNPPIINSVNADRTGGPAPLTVNFTSTATDPDGDPITYNWDFGDGASSGQRNVSHTFNRAGAYDVVLRVTANGATTIASPITITVGSPPRVVIDRPDDGDLFTAGEIISARATATDDGPIGRNDYRWDVALLHEQHQHPAVTKAIGRTIAFEVPAEGHGFEGDTGYRFTVTVTDDSGLTDVASVDVFPDKVDVTIRNGPADTATVDGITVSTPFVIDTVAGFRHQISTPAEVCAGGERRLFDRWSDGRGRTHVITVGDRDSQLQAFYARTGLPCEPVCHGLDVTVSIADGDRPTPGRDVILGTPAADVIDGLAGNDVICGLGGADQIRGGPGADRIFGGAGPDGVVGGPGADRLFGEGGTDWLFGGAGDDRVSGGPRGDVLQGADGDDELSGNGGDDIATGDAGHDVLSGKNGDDVLIGGAGEDVLRGHEGDDELRGEAGADVLRGGKDDDLVVGGGDADRLAGQDGADTLGGGAGDDLVLGGRGNDILRAGGGDDRVRGGGGVDRAYGEAGADSVAGNDGDDFLNGGQGVDLCTGGAGRDYAVNCQRTFGVP